MKKTKRAFTLVELMIVISIIGILVGLLTPMISSAQKRAMTTTSRAFFTSLATSLEQYRSEYGFFPTFLTQRDRVNLDDGINSENFVKSVSGRDPEGLPLSQSDRREFNRRGKMFFEFNAQNLVRRGKSTKWSVVDTLGNPNLYVCVDADNDGFIKQGFPTASDGVNPTVLKELVPNSQTGIRARVLIFTLKKDSNKASADFASEDIFSW